MPQKVLIVEDDGPRRRVYIDKLQDGTDLQVLGAATIGEAIDQLRDNPDTAVAVIDLMLAAGGKDRQAIGAEDDLDGHALARHLRKTYPALKTLALTVDTGYVTSSCKGFFVKAGDPSGAVGVYHKTFQWVLLRHHVLLLTRQPTPVKVFIVYGHDHDVRDQAKEFCEKTFGWAAEVIQPEAGTTWIEKFEEHADEASLAWVMATDDEWGCPRNGSAVAERRPRPNVILEYGYFLGRFGRRSHRVFLFSRPGVVMGSDIAGVAHIRVPGNVSDVEGAIRQHHQVWLL